MRGKPLAKGVGLAALAEATEGASGADLAAICNKAALLAIREYLETRRDSAKGYDDFLIGRKHLDAARAMLTRQRA
jgi:transitional endoplasmic reticulum ATPase